MSPYIWWFSNLEHDIVSKEKTGPSSKKLRKLIETLKTNVNQAKVVSQDIEEVQLEHLNKQVRIGLEVSKPSISGLWLSSCYGKACERSRITISFSNTQTTLLELRMNFSVLGGIKSNVFRLMKYLGIFGRH